MPIEAVPREVRRRSKARSIRHHLRILGLCLANQLGIERSERGDYIPQYFDRFRAFKDYMEATKAEAKEHGYVTPSPAAAAHYPRNSAPPNPQVRAFKTKRAAINAPIQRITGPPTSSRRAIAHGAAPAGEAGLDARMLLQVP